MTRKTGTGRRDNRPVAMPQKTELPEQRYRVTHVQRSGPMPDSAELASYDVAVPGLADRIARQWEVEADFRRELTASEHNEAITHRRLGMAIGAGLQFAVILLGYRLADSGNNTGAGVFLGCGSVASLTAIWKGWHLGKDDDD